MKKLLLVFFIIMFPFCLLGCQRMPRASNCEVVKQDRFIIVKQYSGGGFYFDYFIVADKETKVMYLLIYSGYRAGITALLDENGEIQFYEGDL